MLNLRKSSFFSTLKHIIEKLLLFIVIVYSICMHILSMLKPLIKTKYHKKNWESIILRWPIGPKCLLFVYFLRGGWVGGCVTMVSIAIENHAMEVYATHQDLPWLRKINLEKPTIISCVDKIGLFWISSYCTRISFLSLR